MNKEDFNTWADYHGWTAVKLSIMGAHTYQTWVTPAGAVVYVHYQVTTCLGKQIDEIIGAVQGVMQDN